MSHGTLLARCIRHRSALLALAAVVLLLPACGRSNHKSVHPVQGQVLIGAKPLKSGFVVLHPLNRADLDGVRPWGQVKDGTFTLTTYKANDGAPAGEYAVTIESREPSTKAGESDRPAPNQLPDRYSRPDTSKLVVRVSEGANQLPALQLTK